MTETMNVKKFLKDDFWHYINLGGIQYNQLSSPQLTFTPNTHSYTNGTEKRLIDDMSEAERSTYVATTIVIATLRDNGIKVFWKIIILKS